MTKTKYTAQNLPNLVKKKSPIIVV
jgi:hypothetical protein